MNVQLVTDDPQGEANDILMAREMAEALHAAYPGHLWGVSCDGKTGMADVRNLALSGNWGFRLHLPKIYTASAFKKEVVKAGGELLERYRMPRGKFNADRYAELKLDQHGIPKADL